MKSFFVNLGKLALCGAVVAMIGCTDLYSDIKLVQSESSNAAAELQEALATLQAKLDDDYATKKALADAQAALEAADKANADALQAAVEEVKAALANYATNDVVNAVLAQVTELETALDGAQEELNARLDGLQTALDVAQNEIYGRVEGVEVALSNVINLLADETAALEGKDAEIDAEIAEIYKDLNSLRETASALHTLIEDQKEETAKTNDEIAEIYKTLNSLTGTISSVAFQLAELAEKHDQDVEKLYQSFEMLDGAVSAVNNRVDDLEAALKVQKEALEAVKSALESDIEELFKADDELRENFTQLMNSLQDQIDKLTEAEADLYKMAYSLQEQYTQLINAYIEADEVLMKELSEFVNETKEELSVIITNVINLLQDQVDDLAARVQSLVFIPEYSDGKATIEWGLLIDNDSAVNFLYNTVISYNTLDTFKTYAKKFINKVRGSRYYAYIVRQMKYVLNEMEDAVFGPLDDINAQLDAIFKEIEDLENNLQIDTPDADEIAEAFNELFGGIEELVSYYVAEQLSNAGIPADSDVDPQEITDKIIADLKEAFTFGDVDVNIDLPGFQLPDYKTIVKNLIKKYVKYFKTEGISKVKDIVNKLDDGNISASDIIDGLRLVEFKELLSDLLPVAKKLEAMILENTAILKKESVIRYKVMGQNATDLAAAIAKNPSVLSYDVEAVDVRAAAPALEITKVVAKGDEIHVTVLPQNFNYRFYLTYILEDSFLYGAAESFFDKFGKTGLISYSAALVLNDGNNIRSTEYVNFVSGENPEIFTPEVVNDANQVVETKKVVLSYDTESYEFCSDLHMAYLSVPKRVACTKADLEKQGYSGIVERKEVVYNKTTDLAGPCKFNGFVGTFYDYYPHTFETLWSVNDITLVVKYDVSFE